MTHATPIEEAIALPCAGERLIAIVHRPAERAAANGFGVLIVVGGPQYRAGSHRQFVHLARALAAAGHVVMRFDVRGMGDSTGVPVSFEQQSDDVGSALDALVAHAPGTRRFVLWGLCDGASAALLYVDESRDPRVCGLCLANPWVRSTDSHARTTLRHYYLRRLVQREFWSKLLTGRVGAGAVRNLRSNLRDAVAPPAARTELPFHQRMLRGLAGFEGRVLLLLSGEDYTAREFADRTRDDPRWRAAVGRGNVTRSDLPAADHTFSDPVEQSAAETLTVRWLQSWSATP